MLRHTCGCVGVLLGEPGEGEEVRRGVVLVGWVRRSGRREVNECGVWSVERVEGVCVKRGLGAGAMMTDQIKVTAAAAEADLVQPPWKDEG